MSKKRKIFKGRFGCNLTVAEVQRLPLTEQANLAYALFGRVADGLADFGFDPSIVAQAATDLARDLDKLAGGPPRVVRIDKRRLR